MAVQRAVAEHWKRVTGNVLTQAWGLTETSPAACINRPGDDFNGSIGLPISSTVISIRDDDGKELPQGQSGEICVEGPQVMRGYWNRPDETEKVMLPGQVLRTGDIGYIDPQGFVFIEDRKKDMILVSGFNVYPNEVEGVAVTHPGRARSRGGRAAGRARRRSRRAVRRAQGSVADPGSPDRVLPRAADRLQGAEARVLPRRAAEDQRRQDPAARTEGRAEASGGEACCPAAAPAVSHELECRHPRGRASERRFRGHAPLLGNRDRSPVPLWRTAGHAVSSPGSRYLVEPYFRSALRRRSPGPDGGQGVPAIRTGASCLDDGWHDAGRLRSRSLASYAGGTSLLFTLLMVSLYVWHRTLGSISIETVSPPEVRDLLLGDDHVLADACTALRRLDRGHGRLGYRVQSFRKRYRHPWLRISGATSRTHLCCSGRFC